MSTKMVREGVSLSNGMEMRGVTKDSGKCLFMTFIFKKVNVPVIGYAPCEEDECERLFWGI